MSLPPRPDRPLFFLDYDGTLAPLVDDPMQAYPHARARGLVEHLAAEHPLWIVTGRHLRDLAVLLDLAVPAVGLHGAQEGVIGRALASAVAPEVQRLLDERRATVPTAPGIRVEDKGPMFAVHYRAAPDEAAARRELAAWLEGLDEQIEAVWGKKVVELRAREVSKGTAVRRLAAEHPERTPIYLGDDVTDEDAFAALPADAVTIKVGEGESRAQYRLADVEAVVGYLAGFVT